VFPQLSTVFVPGSIPGSSTTEYARNMQVRVYFRAGLFPLWARFGDIFSQTRPPGHQVVHLFGNVVKVIGEQVPVLIERHRRRLVPELSLHRLDVGTPGDQQRRRRVASLVGGHPRELRIGEHVVARGLRRQRPRTPKA
jgi:hypothetical protein